MRTLIVGVSDKLLMPWLKGKRYMDCSDEGEAIAIAIGYFEATGKAATVFMSADGFCNALNPITSHVIPYGTKMNIVISTGRQEPQHYVMSELLRPIINYLSLIDYDPTKLHFKFIQKK